MCRPFAVYEYTYRGTNVATCYISLHERRFALYMNIGYNNKSVHKQVWGGSEKNTERERERELQREIKRRGGMKRGRQIERPSESEREKREKESGRERETERGRERETDRQTDRQRDIHFSRSVLRQIAMTCHALADHMSAI